MGWRRGRGVPSTRLRRPPADWPALCGPEHAAHLRMPSGSVLPIATSGHVLVVTAYPPLASGTSVLMRNLLSCFDASSFSVGTDRGPVGTQVDGGDSSNVVRAFSSIAGPIQL